LIILYVKYIFNNPGITSVPILDTNNIVPGNWSSSTVLIYCDKNTTNNISVIKSDNLNASIINTNILSLSPGLQHVSKKPYLCNAAVNDNNKHAPKIPPII